MQEKILCDLMMCNMNGPSATEFDASEVISAPKLGATFKARKEETRNRGCECYVQLLICVVSMSGTLSK